MENQKQEKVTSGPISIRMNPETNERFKSLSAEFGFVNQNAAMENLIAAFELQQARNLIPTRAKEIEEFASNNIGCKMSRSTVNNSDLARDMPAVVIATRMHIWTAAAGYVADAVDKVIAGYGHRQVSTSETGADHKALYHALRLIFEANDILDYGELFFPLSPERHAQLLEIKQGRTDRETLYDLIDTEISKLEIRSASIPSNKHEYEYKLDNMIFTLKGKFMVNNYLRGLKKPVQQKRNLKQKEKHKNMHEWEMANGVS